MAVANSIGSHELRADLGSQAEEQVAMPQSLSIVVRALNLDNNADRTNLIELIDSNYGEGFTARVPHLLDSQKDTEDDSDESLLNLIHVVAVEDDRFVAHLAVRKYDLLHRSQSVYELILPAILPAYRREAFRLARMLWKHITEQAERQQVAAIYHYSPLKHPLLQLMAVKCFRSIETGIIPSAPARFGGIRLVPSRNPRKQRAKSLLMCNILNQDAFAATHPLRVPRELSEIVQILCDQLGISRTLIEESVEQIPRVSLVYRSQSSLLSGITDVSLVPLLSTQTGGSSVDEALQQLVDLEQAVGAKASLAVPLLREGASRVIYELLERGYTFSGLRPLPGGRDELLLTTLGNEELNDSVVYSRTAQFLKEFIRNFSANYLAEKH